jgi:hypothetical protein
MVQPEAAPVRAIVVHMMPGRTRLRVPDKRNDTAFFRQLSDVLEADPRVRRVQVNPRTASVLIEHEGTIETIRPVVPLQLRLAEARRARAPGTRTPASPAIVFSAAALACIVLAGFQARRGRFLGSATENIWNAYGAWRGLKMPQVATALLGTGLLQVARGRMLSPAVSLLVYALNMRKLAGSSSLSAPRGGEG